MLVDVNILLYAVDQGVADHERARDWLEEALNGNRRVGLPWESTLGFMRVITHPARARRPLAAADAWSMVESWLEAPAAWVPQPTSRHGVVLGELLRKYRLTGKLVPDAHLVALAIQHGAEIISADSDFARFSEVRWRNPVAP